MSKRTKYLYLIITVCLYCTSFTAQEIFTNNYTVKDGLPSNEVYDVVQDEKGFLWIATDLGVSKYDGNEFINYNFDSTDIDNAILRMHKDHTGRIWFISLNGLLAYYENDSIKMFERNEELKPYVKENGVLSCFNVDHKQQIDFGIRSRGLLKITTDSIYYEPFPDSYAQDTVLKYVDIKDEYVNFYYHSRFIFAQAGKKHFKLNKKKWVEFPEPTSSGYYFYCIKKPENKWICSYSKWLIEIEDEKVTIIKAFPDEIISLKQQEDGVYWVGFANRGGCALYNSKTGTLNYYLKGRNVSSINIDHQNGVWCTTLDKGVFYAQNQKMTNYFLEKSKRTIPVDIDRLNDTLVALFIDGSVFKIVNDSFYEYRKFEKTDSFFWVNTVGHRVFVGSSNHEKIYEVTDKGYEDIELSYHYNSNYRIIMLERNDSICVVSLYSKPLVIARSDYDNYLTEVRKIRKESSCQTKEGIYFGSSAGLWFYNNVYLENVSEKYGIEGRIKNITNNKYGEIITGMKKSGIYWITGDTTYHLTKKEGLSSNYVQQVVAEEDTVWCATEDGISKIIKLKQEGTTVFQIQNVGKQEGILTGDIKKIIPLGMNIWALSDEGIIKVARDCFLKSSEVLLLNLNYITVNNNRISLQKKHVLDYGKNDVQFHFGAIDFHPFSEVNYHYQLTPIDEEVQITQNRDVKYSKLPPGEYSFTLYASSNGNVSEEKVFSFSINSAWWQTWWSYSIGTVLLLLVIVVLFKFRSRVLIRIAVQKEKQEREKMELKLKALRAQMNPHFMFNSLNSILYYILENDIDSAAGYLNKFSRLIRAMLHNSEEGNVDLETEIETLNLYLELEQLRLEKRFDFTITNNIEDDFKEIKIPTLLIQPVIENAVWHGIMKKKEQGKIDVIFNLEDNCVVCTVIDNGVGRKMSNTPVYKSKKQKSMGITITQDRLKMLHTTLNSDLQFETIDLKDDNGRAAGTKVIIRIPRQNSDEI